MKRREFYVAAASGVILPSSARAQPLTLPIVDIPHSVATERLPTGLRQGLKTLGLNFPRRPSYARTR